MVQDLHTRVRNDKTSQLLPLFLFYPNEMHKKLHISLFWVVLVRCVNDYLTVQMSGLGAESSDKGLLFIVWLYILSFL